MGIRYMQERMVQILLVEDDEVDAEAALRAFRRRALDGCCIVVRDGFEALKVLRGDDGRMRLTNPYLILLDINMPRMNGLEFLATLRADPDLKRSIVFILTTSNRDDDKAAAYDLQVAGYLLKANAGEDFGNVMRIVDSYQTLVEFPP